MGVDQAFSFWWPINEPWTGKAVGPGILCPTVWYYFLLITAEEDPKEQDRLWLCAFIGSIAASMVSNTCAIILSMIFASGGLVYLWQCRSWKPLPKLFVTALPGLAVIALSVLM